jgi:hypothetical protein
MYPPHVQPVFIESNGVYNVVYNVAGIIYVAVRIDPYPHTRDEPRETPRGIPGGIPCGTVGVFCPWYLPGVRSEGGGRKLF